MTGPPGDALASYQKAVRHMRRATVLGAAVTFLSLPFLLYATTVVHPFVMFALFVPMSVWMVITLAQEQRVHRLEVGFWIPVDIDDFSRMMLLVAVTAIGGMTGMFAVSGLVFPVPEATILLYAVVVLVTVPIIPMTYVLKRLRARIYRGVSFRYVPGTVDDVVAALRESLTEARLAHEFDPKGGGVPPFQGPSFSLLGGQFAVAVLPPRRKRVVVLRRIRPELGGEPRTELVAVDRALDGFTGEAS